MATYVFQHLSGEFSEVFASTEMFARAEAMKQKWGPPTPLKFPEPGTTKCLIIGNPMYNGYGLHLISMTK